MYLARSTDDGWYYLGQYKKHWTGYTFKRNLLDSWCSEVFEKATSLKLEPGEIHKVLSVTFKLAGK